MNAVVVGGLSLVGRAALFGGHFAWAWFTDRARHTRRVLRRTRVPAHRRARRREARVRGRDGRGRRRAACGDGDASSLRRIREGGSTPTLTGTAKWPLLIDVER
jgi:hypothetical protein